MPKKACSVSGCGSVARAKGLCGKHYMRVYQTGTTDVGAFEKGQNLSWVVNVAAKYTGDACLECAFDNGPGYPRVIINGSRRAVCRVLCEIIYGPPAVGDLQAAHSCGNKRCVNPLHIRWATVKENNADKVIHGTTAHGSRNGNAKLDERQRCAP